MPELPEVETVRRGLEPAFAGARFARVEARRPDLRFPLPVNFVGRLEGRRVEALRRRAKYLLADLDSGETLVMHLGMSGSFRIQDAAVGAFYHPRGDPTHDHIAFAFEGGAHVVYNDPRRFGFMDLVDTATLDARPPFAQLGIEPLSDAFSATSLAAALEGARTPLKAALLDQRRIAGLGNIYVCEALHRARLSPLRLAGALTKAETRRLAKAIPQVLEAAVAAGGSTLRDHRQADGSLGYFQHSFSVYDREGAVCAHSRCGGVISRVVQSGRSTFHCAVCQV